ARANSGWHHRQPPRHRAARPRHPPPLSWRADPAPPRRKPPSWRAGRRRNLAKTQRRLLLTGTSAPQARRTRLALPSWQMDLAAKSALLQTTRRDLGSLLVAYSGGTDSAYLAYVAHQALGENMLAVIADSASLPRAELAAALDFAAAQRIPIQVLHTNEL